MLKILLVEDDKTIVANLTEYLNGAGYIVRSVSGQAAAMAVLAEEKFDAILSTYALHRRQRLFRVQSDQGRI